jgi:Leucine-rich repeat (LRR) protein
MSKIISLTFATIFVAFPSIFAVNSLNCKFTQSLNLNIEQVYTCALENIKVIDESEEIVIAGDHQSELANSDVLQVQILISNTPFIIKETFKAFPNVEDYVISSSKLKNIFPGDFKGLDKLKALKISHNTLAAKLEAGSFEGLSGLTRLNLQNNAIWTIDVNAFKGLDNLAVLQLGTNVLFSLSPNVFSHLSRLVILSMEDNFISRIEKGTFAGLRTLKFLEMNKNRINEIHEDVLDELKTVTQLELNENICVDSIFLVSAINPEQTWSEINENLKKCFENYRK